MSIQTFLDNLRSKPAHVRRRYAFLTSLGITVLVAAFWVRTAFPFDGGSQATVAAVVGKAPSPGQSLVAGVGSVLGDLNNLIFGAKKITYKNIQVRPGSR